MSTPECHDCGLVPFDLPDGVDPEFIFERGDDGVMRCQGRELLAAPVGDDPTVGWPNSSVWWNTPTGWCPVTAPGLSPAEQATVDRFEAAEPAPESWRADYAQGGYIEPGSGPMLEHPAPFVIRVTARPVGDGDGHDELREAEVAIAKWRQGPVDYRSLAEMVADYAEQRARERAAEELEGWARSFRVCGQAGLRRDSRRIFPQVAQVLEAGARDLREAPWTRAARADALAADDRTGQR